MKTYQIQIEKRVEDKASLLREIDVETYLARMKKGNWDTGLTDSWFRLGPISSDVTGLVGYKFDLDN